MRNASTALHCIGSPLLSQMSQLQEKLNKTKEDLEKQRDQAAQIQGRMLQIVAAEQEDKRRIVRRTRYSSSCSFLSVLTCLYTRTRWTGARVRRRRA